jgi:hypothetical protein
MHVLWEGAAGEIKSPAITRASAQVRLAQDLAHRLGDRYAAHVSAQALGMPQAEMKVGRRRAVASNRSGSGMSAASNMADPVHTASTAPALTGVA